jgi:hypothetical protein
MGALTVELGETSPCITLPGETVSLGFTYDSLHRRTGQVVNDNRYPGRPGRLGQKALIF